MDIKELKQKIENNTLTNDILIFKYKKDNKFICIHYIQEISKIKNLDLIYIETLDDIVSDFFAEENSTCLYVYETDFLESLDASIQNLIIVTPKISKNIALDYIEFPEIQNWQIEEFIKFRLPGLKTQDVNWLCNTCNYDYNRLDLETKKLELFDKKAQPIIFKDMLDDGVFNDLIKTNIFDFIRALVNKDINCVGNILISLEYIDIEPAGCLTLLHKEFYKLILVSFNSQWNETMTPYISDKQFYYYKKNVCGKYTKAELVKKFTFLTSLDSKLKNGFIEYKNMLMYIVMNIL